MMGNNNIKTIRVLPLEEIFFLKKISLDETSTSDIICYARKVRRDYRLTPKKDSNERHLILGYREEEYPSDELDKDIIEHIRRTFPGAKSKTSLMMFNVDKESNSQWLSQYKREILHVSIEYIHSAGSLIRSGVSRREVEVLSFPIRREHQSRWNANISIVTNDADKYKRLCSLLNETYDQFSKVCK